ncbi:MAG TPA: hypothetical protein VF420_08695 [Casimicrobiaceae bacterium]
MKHAPTPNHRVAIAFAAIAATATVLGATVVAPARLDSLTAATQIRSTQVAAPSEVVIVPSIEVIGSRDARVVSARGSALPERSKQQI